MFTETKEELKVTSENLSKTTQHLEVTTEKLKETSEELVSTIQDRDEQKYLVHEHTKNEETLFTQAQEVSCIITLSPFDK